MKRLITVFLLLLLPLSVPAATKHQILIRVPVTVTDSLGTVIEPHSNPDSVLSRACRVDSRMGQITVNNKRFTIFGYLSGTHLDTVTFNLLKEQFPDIEVMAVPLEQQ